VYYATRRGQVHPPNSDFCTYCVLLDAAIFQGLHTSTQVSGKGREEGPELLLRHGPLHFLLFSLPLRSPRRSKWCCRLRRTRGRLSLSPALSPARKFVLLLTAVGGVELSLLGSPSGHAVNGRRPGHPGN
jgi:hypothetical protein